MAPRAEVVDLETIASTPALASPTVTLQPSVRGLRCDRNLTSSRASLSKLRPTDYERTKLNPLHIPILLLSASGAGSENYYSLVLPSSSLILPAFPSHGVTSLDNANQDLRPSAAGGCGSFWPK